MGSPPPPPSGGYWGSDAAAESEATPIMRPVKLELAPHARLGRRVNAVFAMVVLLVFHTTLIVSGVLNWDVPCEYHLSRFLVIYGGCGLLFVYLLLREWMFYARLGSWPSTTTFLLLCIFYAANVGAGVILTMYTIRSRDTCRITAPLLYRWCFAAALFCCILIALCLLVPLIRCAARCFCAPIALCLIGCVETVGMDVDIGVVSGGASMSAASAQHHRKAVQKQFLPAALMICTGVLCAPCYFVYAGILSPICRPVSVLAFKLFECLGCVSILPDGTLEVRNCFGEVTCGWLVRHATQCLMAPGMTTPGRSIVGAFVNTTALLWFWCYLLFELYWNWNLMCDSAVPDSEDTSSSWKWFTVLSPSPVHWLILIFAVSGLVITLSIFVVDMFTSPRAPPRSAFEVHKWKMRRQMRICMNLVFFALFCVWGSLLFYFVYSQEECSSSAPSLYRLALLLLLVFFVFLGLACFLFVCVCFDCCLSGRMRLVLLLSDDPARVAPPPGAKDEHHFLVGATHSSTRLAVESPALDRTKTLFTKADKQEMSARLLPEQQV
ncbi:hypothetical protein AB1Y20_016495 [Prymnesium parvum]|uniref:Transmembrane protein n=1 Tax=Prymnesium parvum TaxID=97485 RepID=A0AB34ICJ6_PRYPA